ncbi:hypothetical protein RIF29_19992 [Crotalaria pallida]|uniref:tRNA-splicing endonuclease subunit Sen54 N-terminal domain-containing protein n=1 Tax=Crotalaria pallida TaxID=3830 RepID=A0AAN9I4M1_CROPI
MEGKVWECSLIENSDDEVLLQNASDEEEHSISSGSMQKLQFRSVKSKAIWNDELGMAEVVDKKGKMWLTTGIIRSGKTYFSLEETLYLMEVGALQLLDNCDTIISLTEMYKKITSGKSGCCWELYEVYRHLKSLGYIVGRHGLAWSVKSIQSVHKPVSLEGIGDNKQMLDVGSNIELPINELFREMQISDLRPDFDVYLPNNKFRKSSPGDPSFLLHLSRDHPPSRAEIEVLERQCGGVPLKVCLVDNGRVSFFSFEKVELLVLP